MEYKTDIEIAQACEIQNIREIAAAAGIEEKYLEPYGRYRRRWTIRRLGYGQCRTESILLTAITPLRRARERQQRLSDCRRT